MGAKVITAIVTNRSIEEASTTKATAITATTEDKRTERTAATRAIAPELLCNPRSRRRADDQEARLCSRLLRK
jgi:hypothetical protein